MSTPEPPELSRSQRREKAAADALRALIRDTLLEKFPLLSETPTEVPLQLSLKVNCSDPGHLTFDPDLRSQLLEQATIHLQPRQKFQPGTVYDFHAGKNFFPPHPLQVFTGYDPFGHPKWAPVSEVLSGDERFRLFRGKELKQEQLPDWGKNDRTFNILGQVVTGPWEIPRAYGKLCGHPEIALSCQIVESRDVRAHFSLRLNLLAAGLVPDELESLLQEPALGNLGSALRDLEREVEGLEVSAQKAWHHQKNRELDAILQKIPALLKRLIFDLGTE
ncbi:MAG: hypothetical protein ACO3N7_06970 [Kiritimatiellia bacterium]